jgi:hypothetical protein
MKPSYTIDGEGTVDTTPHNSKSGEIIKEVPTSKGVWVDRKWLEVLIKYAEITTAYDDAISCLKQHALSADIFLKRK